MKYFENISEFISQTKQNFEQSNIVHFDVVIVGGGPAGIAAVTSLADLQKILSRSDSDTSTSKEQLRQHIHSINKEENTNNTTKNFDASVPFLSVLIVDSGKDFYQRSHQSPHDIGSGIGGAGLFSDGKFSFWPSGSLLYQLKDISSLEVAYNRIAYYLSSVNQQERSDISIPVFPSQIFSEDSKNSNEPTLGKWFQKKYPSIYLDLDQRKRLIENMLNRCENSQVSNIPDQYFFLCNSSVCDITCTTTNNTDFEYTTFITSANSIKEEKPPIYQIKSKYLVLATGKYGPLIMKNYQLFQHSSISNQKNEIKSKYKYRRIELGFRITQPSHSSFFANSIVDSLKFIDPKFQFKDFISTEQLNSSHSHVILPKLNNQINNSPNIEWRTFCACKDGEVASCFTQGIWSVSGRSDCPRTHSNNIGLNTRILDESLFLEILKRSHGSYFASITNRGTDSTYNQESNNCFEFPLIDLLPILQDFLSINKELNNSKKLEAERKFINCYGADLSSLLILGLAQLINHFPSIISSAIDFPNETRIVGPQIEGVGYYPDTSADANLKLKTDCPNSSCWVVGDCTGIFRGTVASLVSGYFCGIQIFQDYKNKKYG